jgi:hypothetical protein
MAYFVAGRPLHTQQGRPKMRVILLALVTMQLVPFSLEGQFTEREVAQECESHARRDADSMCHEMWVRTRSADAFTDVDTSFAFTLDLHNATPIGSLSFKCMADGLNVILGIGKYYGGRDNRIAVEYRFDSKPAVGRHNWTLLGNEAAWMPMNRVDGFVREAQRSNYVMVRAVDTMDGETRTFRFSLR